jgi:hypothetical protein
VETANRPWWGIYELAQDQAGAWRIGPLSLWLRRRPFEWRAAWSTGRDDMDEALSIEVPTASDPPPGATTRRYAAGQLTDHVELWPTLMDRPVVVRPEIPLDVLPQEEVTLYMSTPVQVRLRIPETGAAMDEVPSFRPSDTWFGPNTRVGELCYASRIHARLHLDEFRHRPGRATTAVRLRNRTRAGLRLDRFSLPVPSLRVFADAAGRLWTEAVTVEHEGDLAEVQVRLQGGPPDLAGPCAPLTPPRTPPDRNVLVRAFEALFG